MTCCAAGLAGAICCAVSLGGVLCCGAELVGVFCCAAGLGVVCSDGCVKVVVEGLHGNKKRSLGLVVEVSVLASEVCGAALAGIIW